MKVESGNVKIISIAAVAIVAIIAVTFVSLNSNNDEDQSAQTIGLTGSFELITEGKYYSYNGSQKGYVGTWSFNFNNGDLIYESKNINSVSVNQIDLSTRGINIVHGEPWIQTPPVGYVDKVKEKNHMFKNMLFRGLVTLDIPNHGSKSLSCYWDVIGSIYYYVDSNGIINRIDLSYGTISDGPSVKMVFYLR